MRHLQRQRQRQRHCGSLSSPAAWMWALVWALLPLVASETPELEVAALRRVYEATDGGRWVWPDEGSSEGRPRWNFTLPDAETNPCSDGGRPY
jgi:hypothetical protein